MRDALPQIAPEFEEVTEGEEVEYDAHSGRRLPKGPDGTNECPRRGLRRVGWR